MYGLCSFLWLSVWNRTVIRSLNNTSEGGTRAWRLYTGVNAQWNFFAENACPGPQPISSGWDHIVKMTVQKNIQWHVHIHILGYFSNCMVPNQSLILHLGYYIMSVKRDVSVKVKAVFVAMSHF